MSYLTHLTLRLNAAVAGLPEEVRSRHAAYLATAQADDGGFPGREGAGDLYYTSFGLRALALLGALDDTAAVPAAAFLRRRLDPSLPAIDFLSWVISAVLVEMAADVDVFADAGRDRRQTVIDFVERFRRPDGGYAKTERGGQGSTYHTFLVTLCKEMVGAPLDGAQRMVELIRSRQRDDGGFVEVAPLRQGGTNPTAAAVGLLRLLNALDESIRASAGRFLAGMQTSEGGLRANGRIPMADLLSTFTGLVALHDVNAVAAIDTDAVLRFAQSLARPDGGFRAGHWDQEVDVEYTFYGLGTLGLLTAREG
ncbi:MAG: terpene cyclase/mutase family protein [Pirellulales bacterium]|nr:terpene cyclase/mutase family protein [Pirellulales bacterium]